MALYMNSEHHRCRWPVFRSWRCTDVSNNSEWLFLGAGSCHVCCTGMFWEAHPPGRPIPLGGQGAADRTWTAAVAARDLKGYRAEVF